MSITLSANRPQLSAEAIYTNSARQCNVTTKRRTFINMSSGEDGKTQAEVSFDAIDPGSISPFTKIFFFPAPFSNLISHRVGVGRAYIVPFNNLN